MMNAFYLVVYCLFQFRLTCIIIIISISLTGRSLVGLTIANAHFALADDYEHALAPGVYESLTGISLIGDIYLDNTSGDANSNWVFTVDSLSAAASCKMFLKTEGVGTVTWNVDGAIFLGADIKMIGNMISTLGRWRSYCQSF
jgi:hypothetical protein